jgi:hypothetical protein
MPESHPTDEELSVGTSRVSAQHDAHLEPARAQPSYDASYFFNRTSRILVSGPGPRDGTPVFRVQNQIKAIAKISKERPTCLAEQF